MTESEAVTPQITCVLSAVLGNRTFSNTLADAVDRSVGPTKRLWFDGTVYRAYPAPPWLQRISAYESEYVARRWLRDNHFDGKTVINGYPLAMAGKWRSMVVATDATPAMIVRMGDRLASRIINRSISIRFRAFARRVSAWLPVSETCRRSLVSDYGVPAERCFVTRGPQRVVDPKPHTPSGSVLFVGNDFVRKGGTELLRAFEQNLLPDYRLTIVSNDSSLINAQKPESVRVISGIHDPEELSDIYRNSDLLVLPTRFDVYSFVICEAAAHGIPALATRVGGVGELLDESGGLSLPPRCSARDIASGIHEALGSSYASHASSASQFAREMLTLSAFDQRVRDALAMT